MATRLFPQFEPVGNSDRFKFTVHVYNLANGMNDVFKRKWKLTMLSMQTLNIVWRIMSWLTI